ncbi:MAG: exodeoxyribonuclease VII small subunit [Methylotenera sp.]|nr:exodeoxyribonuclease VII small subunit [Methylotenera sp.]MSP99482.1 exodeoxyribonuclease VII small subunit [Methylotenera sp.]
MTTCKTNTKYSAEHSAEKSMAQPEDFEHAFTELENIVAQMESGQMALETSLAAYKRGNTLLQFCQKSLADVEQQVQILNASNQLLPFKSQED